MKYARHEPVGLMLFGIMLFLWVLSVASHLVAWTAPPEEPVAYMAMGLVILIISRRDRP